MTITTTDLATARVQLTILRTQMKGAFIARDAEIDGLLLALLARTHVLLLGPPGTAKSLVTQVFAGALGGDYFQRLLTAFTAPEELFGPYDLSALDAGRYERAVQGYLPTATVAFCDEVFKANSAILNSMLTVLNERQFDNGTQRLQLPLELCVGASNEYPEDASLDALYDRFTLRYWTQYVPTRAGRLALLTAADPAQVVTAKLAPEAVRVLQQAVRDVVVPPQVLELLCDVADKLAKDNGITVSDRRLRGMVRLLQASAALDGRTTATSRDLLVLADSVWHRHEQRPAVLATVMAVAAPQLAAATKLADSAREVYDAVKDVQGDGARALQRIKAIEAELANLGVDDSDVAACHAQVTELRKGLARRFMAASGLGVGIGA
jgi:MoxR-like ATPase